MNAKYSTPPTNSNIGITTGTNAAGIYSNMDMIPKMERIIIVVKLPVVNEYNEGNQNNNNNNDDDNDDGNDEDDLSLECTTCHYNYCYD